MIKRVTIISKRPGLSDAEFYDRWRVQHAEMVLRLPGVCGYVQNHVVAGATEDAKGRRVDGIAEIWFDDAAIMAQALETDIWTAIVDDAREFLGDIAGYTVQEHVIRSASQDMA